MKRLYLEKFQHYYLECAGYVVKVVVNLGEQELIREIVDDYFGVTLRNNGFVKNKVKSRVDYTIVYGWDQGVFKVKRENKIEKIDSKKVDTKNKIIYLSSAMGFEYINFVIKTLFSELLEISGFVMHCSSVVDKYGNVSLFLAESGGGKSTTMENIVLQSKLHKHVCDDMLVIKKEKDQWFLYTLPIFEKKRYCTNMKFPLKNVKAYLIEKNEETFVEKIDLSTKLPVIIGQIWTLEGNITGDLFELVGELVQKMDIQKLNILKADRRVFEYI